MAELASRGRAGGRGRRGFRPRGGNRDGLQGRNGGGGGGSGSSQIVTDTNGGESLLSRLSQPAGTERKRPAEYEEDRHAEDERTAQEHRPAQRARDGGRTANGRGGLPSNGHSGPTSSRGDLTRLGSVRDLGGSVRFDSLANRLAPEILSSIPFTHMSEVQAASFDPITSGIDVVAKAKTGTGKTIAFLLPLIQRLCTQQLSRASPCPVSVLILCPTRELAIQTNKEADLLLKNLKGKIGVQHCIGGTNMTTEQRRLQNQRVDILVATPGRLVDHLENGNLNRQFSAVQVLVLDEADRMLDMGFEREMRKIVNAMSPNASAPRQTLLFSATMPDKLHQVAKLQPNHAVINTLPPHEENTHKHVKQTAFVAPHDQMFALMTSRLLSQLREHPQTLKVIIFFPAARWTALAASFLRALQAQIPELATVPVFEAHSRKSQAHRTKTNADFGKTKSGILVSSDVTARGIDFPDVTHVLQVGLPDSVEQYIHRLGRTARAGADGAGTLMLAPYEEAFLRSPDLNSLPITRESIPANVVALQAPVHAALKHVSDKEKAQTYAAVLGYYKNKNKLTKLTPAQLVATMNEWARTALLYKGGATGVPPPGLLKKTVGLMGLKGTPGLNIVSALPE